MEIINLLNDFTSHCIHVSDMYMYVFGYQCSISIYATVNRVMSNFNMHTMFYCKVTCRGFNEVEKT